MKNYLKNYIKEIDNKISINKITKSDVEEHLIKIQFFQHERLVHLLVTLAYALFTIIFIFLTLYHPLFFIITIIVLVLKCVQMVVRLQMQHITIPLHLPKIL